MNKSDYVITNIVAFGVGSIHSIFGDGEDGEWINQYQESSAGQLAAILTLSEVLGEPGKPLPCVIQEPAYSSVEKVWLKSLGFEVVDDPDTFARVNLESLVFAVNTIMEIGWWLSRGTAPAAIISLDWCNRSCTITWPDDDSFPLPPDVSRMMDQYEVAEFLPLGNVEEEVSHGYNGHWEEESRWIGVYLFW